MDLVGLGKESFGKRWLTGFLGDGILGPRRCVEGIRDKRETNKGGGRSGNGCPRAIIDIWSFGGERCMCTSSFLGLLRLLLDRF